MIISLERQIQLALKTAGYALEGKSILWPMKAPVSTEKSLWKHIFSSDPKLYRRQIVAVLDYAKGYPRVHAFSDSHGEAIEQALTGHTDAVIPVVRVIGVPYFETLITDFHVW